MSSDELYVNLVLLTFLIVSFLLNLKFNQINKILNDELRLQRIIIKEHEAQQMKEPFYQLDEEQEQSLQEYKNTYLYFKSIGRKWDQDFKVDHAFAEWAIEQEKLKEEK